jgi:hypothetical protein
VHIIHLPEFCRFFGVQSFLLFSLLHSLAWWGGSIYFVLSFSWGKKRKRGSFHLSVYRVHLDTELTCNSFDSHTSLSRLDTSCCFLSCIKKLHHRQLAHWRSGSCLIFLESRSTVYHVWPGHYWGGCLGSSLSSGTLEHRGSAFFYVYIEAVLYGGDCK